MGTISYDPVKNRFAALIRNSGFLRTLFYYLLDLFFLRSWHVRRILKKEGGKLDKKGKWTLLDAGCGFGQDDRFILKHFNNVEIVSVDIKEEYLEDCRNYFKNDINQGIIKFRNADLLGLKPDQSFDFILCVDVLEHIENDQQVINNLAGLLKPGGKILMHSPSHFSEGDAGGGESFVGEHARAGYSKRDIYNKFRKAGLITERTHYTYGLPGHLAWVLTIKYPMMLLNRTGLAGLILLLPYYLVILSPCLLLNFVDLFTKNEKGNGVYALGSK
jgi:SAM-dependent methyltransferase